MEVPTRGRAFDIAAAIVLCVLVATSRLQTSGDGREYVLMAERFAHARSPAVPVAQARAAGVFDRRLINRHGAQEMWHFWFVSLCVAPLMALTSAVGAPPALPFAIFNSVLIWAAFRTVRRRFGVMTAVALCASPIVWWIDKAQVEAFTFACLTLGLAALPDLAVAALWFALAATQNPPIGALTLGLAVWTWVGPREVRDRNPRLWLWLIAIALLALHPLYYWVQLGRTTPLVETGDLRIPGLRSLITPIVDLNVGLLINAPVVAGALLILFLGAVRRSPRAALATASVWLLFLTAFAQAENVNSGGTPGMARYALWLMPPALLLLHGRPQSLAGRSAGAIATALSVACALIWFRPTLPESYLFPTRTALYVWENYPGLENPLPEIFAERLRHADNVNTLASTPTCAKALLQSGQWPADCPRVETVEACRAEGALCYANRQRDGTYVFVKTSRRGGINVARLLFD